MIGKVQQTEEKRRIGLEQWEEAIAIERKEYGRGHSVEARATMKKAQAKRRRRERDERKQEQWD